MRSLKELEPYLPLQAGGLTLSWDDSIQGQTAAARMGAFMTMSNTPAVQEMTKAYDPRDIVKQAEKVLDRDYDEELLEWEGDLSDILKPRGGRNPFHLLEQLITMGPTGDEFKRGPAPLNWDVFYQAVDHLIGDLKAKIGSNLRAKHMAMGSPKSAQSVLKFAHVKDNSAGEPFLSDPNVKRVAKKYHIQPAMQTAIKFLRDTAALPLWRFLTFARGDRAAPFDNYLDDEKSRDKAVFEKRDRKIDAQSFILQLLDGIFTQPLADAISVGPVPESDMREPARLSHHFQAGHEIMQRLGREAFSIGRDESSWDQHVTPQGWYACYLVYRALFAPEQSILVFLSEESVVVDNGIVESLANLASGEARTIDVPTIRGEGIVPLETTVVRVDFKTDDVLKRMFAGASGTGARNGPIVVDGYQHVLDTPRDGKMLLGWAMRSGNFCTFLGNSIINWHKTLFIHYASKDENVLQEYHAMHGYVPPPMWLEWLVLRGDDAGDIWRVPDRSKDWKISELVQDWLLLTGAKANAKKQDTSDVRGRWRISFAQLFSSERFPRGVSSMVRVLERNIWNEADEVVPYDPDTGEDLRDVLFIMNSYGRINNLWGVWDREIHPAAKQVTDLLQDLDSRRILPPLDAKERERAARAYALKLMRRGQISASQIDSAIRHFWATDLAQHALDRYDRNAKLQDHSWSPLTRHGDDARDYWR